MSARRIMIVPLLALVFVAGCGRGDLPRRAVCGNVTCGGEKVAMGMLRFVPMEAESLLPSTSGRIVDGQYRIDQRGGVPLGSIASRSTLDGRPDARRRILCRARRSTRLSTLGQRFMPAHSRRWWSK